MSAILGLMIMGYGLPYGWSKNRPRTRESWIVFAGYNEATGFIPWKYAETEISGK